MLSEGLPKYNIKCRTGEQIAISPSNKTTNVLSHNPNDVSEKVRVYVHS